MVAFRVAISELTKDEVINDYKNRKQAAVMNFIEVWAKATRTVQKSRSRSLGSKTDEQFTDYNSEQSQWNRDVFGENEPLFFAKSLNVSVTFKRR